MALGKYLAGNLMKLLIGFPTVPERGSKLGNAGYPMLEEQMKLSFESSFCWDQGEISKFPARNKQLLSVCH